MGAVVAQTVGGAGMGSGGLLLQFPFATKHLVCWWQEKRQDSFRAPEQWDVCLCACVHMYAYRICKCVSR